jgi:hypothetical protein
MKVLKKWGPHLEAWGGCEISEAGDTPYITIMPVRVPTAGGRTSWPFR